MNLEVARIQLQTTQNDDTKLAYKQLANDETEWETFQTRNDKGKLIKIREMFSHLYLQCINTAPEDQTISVFSKLHDLILTKFVSTIFNAIME